MNLIKAIRLKQKKGLVPVIAEIKRRIPKLAKERSLERDLRDAGVFARLYSEGGAVGISLVAEKKHFGGQPEIDIPSVLGSVKLPLLIKDFIFDKEKVDFYVKLISKIGKKELSRVTMVLISHRIKMNVEELARYIYKQGISVLIETRGIDDLKFITLPERIPLMIGINNKNIDELETDKDKVKLTKKLMSDYRGIIGKTIFISESGHRRSRDVRISIEAGADAVLVGTAFMQAEDPTDIVGNFVNALRKES